MSNQNSQVRQLGILPSSEFHRRYRGSDYLDRIWIRSGAGVAAYGVENFSEAALDWRLYPVRSLETQHRCGKLYEVTLSKSKVGCSEMNLTYTTD